MENAEKNIAIDRVGNEVDLSLCPECRAHPDCFAWMEGRCTALLEVSEPCHFYKNADETISEARRCYQRLKALGRTDLLRKYMAAHTALGFLDGEIEEAERYGDMFEAFRAENYQKQLERTLVLDSSDDDLFDDEETGDAGND